jgi:hypothetical protein
MSDSEKPDKASSDATEDNRELPEKSEVKAAEYGGPKGKEPTRYGDWEKNGRCIDF